MSCKPPVRMVPLLKEKLLTTNGTGSYVLMRIGPQQLWGIGPLLDGITLYGILRDKSANFEYKVVGEWSNDGETWTAFGGDILGPTSANGQVVSAEFTVALDFGLYVRLMVGVKPTTGTAIETGVLSLTARFRLKS